MSINKNKKGFSLIEVLVSVLILTLGIAAISALMGKNIGNSLEAKNQIVASMLAQEGIELFRNVRDNNLTSATPFTSDGPCVNSGVYYPETLPGTSCNNLSVGTGPQLNLFPASQGYDSKGGGTASKFYREVNVTKDTINDEVIVQCSVSWNDSGSFSPCSIGNKCVQASAIFPDP